MKTIIAIIIYLTIFTHYTNAQWVETSTSIGLAISDLSFINSNTGFALTSVYSSNTNNFIVKTTNKGISWIIIDTLNTNSKNASIDFINETTGFLSTKDKIYKTINGGVSWFEKFTFNQENDYSRIRFGNLDTGYASFSKLFNSSIPGSGGIYLYKTVDGGNSWNPTIINGLHIYSQSRISDIAVSKYNSSLVSICGFRIENNLYNSIFFSSNNGFQTNYQTDNSIPETRFDRITFSPLNGENYILSNKGIFKENTNVLPFNEPNFSEQIGINIDNNGIGYAITQNKKVYKTSNNGNTWFLETTYLGSPFSSSRVINFGNIIYSGMVNGKMITRLITSDLKTFFDNQSVSQSFLFDNISYNTPSTNYLRGGLSKLNCSNIIEDKNFYKWSDGSMNSSNQNYYFDLSGTTISNYYKTK